MGAKNHQPCSKHPELSIIMSRAMTAANSEIDLANVELEDILLEELSLNAPNRQRLNLIVLHLQNALSKIKEGKKSAEQLKSVLEAENFIDSKDQGVLNSITEHLLEGGMTEEHYAKIVMKDRLDGGFLTSLDRMISNFDKIMSTIAPVVSGFKTLLKGDGMVFSDLEFNTPDNIKSSFARLYVVMSETQGYFQASAMISTELFYRVASLGNLDNPVKNMDTEQLFADFVRGDAISKLAS